jgi:hypothetical protein
MNEQINHNTLTEKQAEAIKKIVQILNENNLTVIVEPQVKFISRVKNRKE